MIEVGHRGDFIMNESDSLKGRGRLVVSFSVGHYSGRRGLTQNSQVMLICTESSQSGELRRSPRPCGTRGRVSGGVPGQQNWGRREGRRKEGSNQGREGGKRTEQGRAAPVSGEMPPWPRPHLEAIVMSPVELPAFFLPQSQ